MIVITREKAHSCTDNELLSALAKLFNALASNTLNHQAHRSTHASIEAVRAELRRRGPA